MKKDIKKLKKIYKMLDKIEEGSKNVSRYFNNRNFNFRNVLEEEISRLKKEFKTIKKIDKEKEKKGDFNE